MKGPEMMWMKCMMRAKGAIQAGRGSRHSGWKTIPRISAQAMKSKKCTYIVNTLKIQLLIINQGGMWSDAMTYHELCTIAL